MRMKHSPFAAAVFIAILASIPAGTAGAQTSTHDGFAITGAMKCGTTENVTLRYSPQTALIDNDPQRSPYARWKIGFANPGTYTIRIANNNLFGVRLSTWPSSNPSQITFHDLKWPAENPPGQFNWSEVVTVPEMHIGVAHLYPVGNSRNQANNFTISLTHPDCSEAKRLTSSGISNIEKLKLMLTRFEYDTFRDDPDLDIGDDLVELDEDDNTGAAGFDQADANRFCRENYSDNRVPIPTGDGGYVCVVLSAEGFSCPPGGCPPPPRGAPGQIPAPPNLLGQDACAFQGGGC